jgi:hypothetical protein
MYRKKQVLLLLGAAACFTSLLNRRKRRYPVRPFLRNRKSRGDYYIAVGLILDSFHARLNCDAFSNFLGTGNDSRRSWIFFETFRMTPKTFDYLLSLIGPEINKHSRREAISASERLQMTVV